MEYGPHRLSESYGGYYVLGKWMRGDGQRRMFINLEWDPTAEYDPRKIDLKFQIDRNAKHLGRITADGYQNCHVFEVQDRSAVYYIMVPENNLEKVSAKAASAAEA